MSDEWTGPWALDDLLQSRVSGYWGDGEASDRRAVPVNVVRNGDISRDGLLTGAAPRFFSEREREKSLIQPGDVLLTSSGEVGKVCLPLSNHGTNLVASNFVRLLRPAQDQLSGEFLRLVLEGPATREMLPQHTGGSTIPNLLASFFSEEFIRLPPLAIQRRMTDLMAHLDGHLANLRGEREAADHLLVTSRQVLMGHLPTVPLTSVLKNARAGGTPDRKRPDFYGGDIPWLKSGEVQADFIRTTEERITSLALASSSAWLLPPGTPVLAMYGATAGVSGYAAVEMSTNQAVLALVPDPARADSRFLFHWLRLNGPALKQAATGAAQPNLSKQVVMRELGFPAMDVSDQRAVAQTLDSISALTDDLGNEIQDLIELRSRVLAGLLAGDCPISVEYDSLLSEVA